MIIISKLINNSISINRFPTDPVRRKKWAIKIKRTDPITGKPWEPSSSSVICSQHFMPEDFYMQWSRKLLKPMAIPSIFSFAPPAKKHKAPLERTSSTYSQIVSCTSDSCSDDPTTWWYLQSVLFLHMTLHMA